MIFWDAIKEVIIFFVPMKFWEICVQIYSENMTAKIFDFSKFLAQKVWSLWQSIHVIVKQQSTFMNVYL